MKQFCCEKFREAVKRDDIFVHPDITFDIKGAEDYSVLIMAVYCPFCGKKPVNLALEHLNNLLHHPTGALSFEEQTQWDLARSFLKENG